MCAEISRPYIARRREISTGKEDIFLVAGKFFDVLKGYIEGRLEVPVVVIAADPAGQTIAKPKVVGPVPGGGVPVGLCEGRVDPKHGRLVLFTRELWKQVGGHKIVVQTGKPVASPVQTHRIQLLMDPAHQVDGYLRLCRI